MRALRLARVRSKGPQQLMQEHTQELWSTREPATRPDIDTLNSLIDVDSLPQGSDDFTSACLVNTATLRRHFAELTANFLAPFSPYVRGALPQPGRCPFTEPPTLKPFHAADFLEELEVQGPGPFMKRRLRQNWLKLYRTFLCSPTFASWFQRRRLAAERAQQRAWRQARVGTDIAPFLSELSEVSLVDAFNVVEAQLLAEQESGRSNNGGVERLPSRNGNGFLNLLAQERVQITNKLRRDLWAIYGALPRDVQQTFSFNPQRAAVLRGVMSQTQLRVPGHLERVFTSPPAGRDLHLLLHHRVCHNQHSSPSSAYSIRNRRMSESYRRSIEATTPLGTEEDKFSSSWSHTRKLGDLLHEARGIKSVKEDECGAEQTNSALTIKVSVGRIFSS